MEEVKKWIEMAEMDYGVAAHLFENYYPKPFEIICYHCQQAAEKAIKALIIANQKQGGLPKMHDLSFLLNQIKNNVEIEEKYYEYADTLTPYGVAVRYPNELFLEKRHAEDALQCASEILTWVKTLIGEDIP
jgi:HEPN domain-containing protein